MKETAGDAVDDLFAKIRLQLLKVRESDPATAEELKSLLTQLEDWVEKLVVDSLRLESLQRKPIKSSIQEPKRQEKEASA